LGSRIRIPIGYQSEKPDPYPNQSQKPDPDLLYGQNSTVVEVKNEVMRPRGQMDIHNGGVEA
jgi:hypothetical protein